MPMGRMQGQLTSRSHKYEVAHLVLRIELCRGRAATCKGNAAQANNDVIRASFLRAAATWTKLAEDLSDELGLLKSAMQ
jgi:hypothetical protein